MYIKRTRQNSFKSFTAVVKPLKTKGFCGEKTGAETFTREEILSPTPPGKSAGASPRTPAQEFSFPPEGKNEFSERSIDP